MSQYIVERTKSNRIYLAWIALFLLTFNIYHTRLLNILSLYSPSTTVLIQGIAVCCLVAYLMLGQGLKITSIQLSTTDILLLFSLAAIVISTTKDFTDNFTYLVRYAVYIVVVILLKYDRKLLTILYKCILICSLLHMVFTLWFYWDQDFYLKYIMPKISSEGSMHLYWQVVHNGYATGMASHFSLNGIYMATSLCCVFTLLFERKKPQNAWLIGLLLMLNLVVIFMTGKRAVTAFSIVAIVVTYFVYSKQSLGGKLAVTILSITGAVVLLSTFAVFNRGIASTLTRFANTFFASESGDISTGRFRLYRYAWDFFLDNPILGIGWRRYTQYVVPLFHGKKQLMDTHNVFLQLLCETGVVGFTAFFVLFASAYAATIRYAILSRNELVELPSELKTALVYSLCYQTFFLQYCMTGNPLYDLETLFAYFAAVAVIGHIDYNYKNKIKTDRPRIVSKYIR